MDYSQEIKDIKEQLISLSDRLSKLENSSKTTVKPKKVESKFSNNKVYDNKVYVSTKNESHYISGNTYNIRTLLKEKGSKWDGDEKCWKIKKDSISSNEIINIIEEQGITVVDQNSDSKSDKSDKTKKTTKTNKTRKVTIENNTTNGSRPKNNEISSSGGFAMLSDSDSD